MACDFPNCECQHPPEKCFFKPENRLGPDQRRCIYGWVLPDKCQAIDPEKGCPCGDYPNREEYERLIIASNTNSDTGHIQDSRK